MGKNVKTNAMRILERNKIEFEALSVESSGEPINGLIIAEKNGKDPSLVHKTLVARGSSKELYVFIVPVSGELDLKKAAMAASEKKIEMLPHKDLLSVTGYIKGGCSPVGMKKLYKTFVNSAANDAEKIIVSGGKIGFQVEIKVADLLKVVNAELKDLQKD